MTAPLHGWIILDKPYGLGSTQAVAAVKRCLREAGHGKVKVGHGGTLDPLATGVLPVALGEATKLAGRMLDSDKTYDFTITFGTQTDTLDAEGQVIATSEVRPTCEEIEAMLPRFTGFIEQTPPAYSALKIEGRRAYDLARAGEEIALKTRAVRVHALYIQNPTPTPPLKGRGLLAALPQLPSPSGEGLGVGDGLNEITLSARVSKGTYIRSLARDIALALGTVGHVTMLRRTRAGPFTLNSAISLDKLNEAAKARDIAQYVLPLTVGLDDIPALSVTPDQALALKQGKMLAGNPRKQGLMLALEGETPIALVEGSGPDTNPVIKVVRGFNI